METLQFIKILCVQYTLFKENLHTEMAFVEDCSDRNEHHPGSLDKNPIGFYLLAFGLQKNKLCDQQIFMILTWLLDIHFET